MSPAVQRSATGNRVIQRIYPRRIHTRTRPGAVKFPLKKKRFYVSLLKLNTNYKKKVKIQASGMLASAFWVRCWARVTACVESRMLSVSGDRDSKSWMLLRKVKTAKHRQFQSTTSNPESGVGSCDVRTDIQRTRLRSEDSKSKSESGPGHESEV